MKIQKKHEMKVTLAIMVLIMTMVVSFASVILNFGLDNAFLIKWLKSWAFSYIIALPVVMIVMPFTKKLVSKFVEK